MTRDSIGHAPRLLLFGVAVGVLWALTWTILMLTLPRDAVFTREQFMILIAGGLLSIAYSSVRIWIVSRGTRPEGSSEGR